MLHLFYTEVTVLYVSNESIDYVAFVLYRSVCPVCFRRVNGLCCICSIQKWLSCMFPKSQLIWLHLFYTEVYVLCDAIESMDYVAFVLYRSDCPVCFHRVNGLCCICFIQKWLSLYVSIESMDYVAFVLYRSDCPVWCHLVNRLCCICSIQKWLPCVMPSSEWIMLHLVYTEVTALYVSIESMDYVAFVLYRSDCSVCSQRVNRLCCICFIQKCMSCVVPSSQWIMFHLFYTEMTVPVCFQRVNGLCCICFIQKWLSCVVPSSQWIMLHLLYI